MDTNNNVGARASISQQLTVGSQGPGTQTDTPIPSTSIFASAFQTIRTAAGKLFSALISSPQTLATSVKQLFERNASVPSAPNELKQQMLLMPTSSQKATTIAEVTAKLTDLMRNGEARTLSVTITKNGQPQTLDVQVPEMFEQDFTRVPLYLTGSDGVPKQLDGSGNILLSGTEAREKVDAAVTALLAHCSNNTAVLESLLSVANQDAPNSLMGTQIALCTKLPGDPQFAKEKVSNEYVIGPYEGNEASGTVKFNYRGQQGFDAIQASEPITCNDSRLDLSLACTIGDKNVQVDDLNVSITRNFTKILSVDADQEKAKLQGRLDQDIEAASFQVIDLDDDTSIHVANAFLKDCARTKISIFDKAGNEMLQDPADPEAILKNILASVGGDTALFKQLVTMITQDTLQAFAGPCNEVLGKVPVEQNFRPSEKVKAMAAWPSFEIRNFDPQTNSVQLNCGQMKPLRQISELNSPDSEAVALNADASYSNAYVQMSISPGKSTVDKVYYALELTAQNPAGSP